MAELPVDTSKAKDARLANTLFQGYCALAL
jgi:hypothetical protein